MSEQNPPAGERTGLTAEYDETVVSAHRRGVLRQMMQRMGKEETVLMRVCTVRLLLDMADRSEVAEAMLADFSNRVRELEQEKEDAALEARARDMFEGD